MISQKDMRYFDVARTVALTASYKRIKIGAIIVLKKQIISIGVNSYKTHPLQRYYNKYRDIPSDSNHTLHAEVEAISRIPKDIDLKDAALYVYREHPLTHQLANSRPCPSCMALIKSKGVRKLYYTTEDGYCFEQLT